MNYRFKRPSPGMLIIDPFEESDRTESGLYIPETAAREGSTTIGRIFMTNPPADDNPAEYFQIGEVVVIGKWSGTEIWLGSRHTKKKYIIVNEDSVLTTLEPDDSN